MAAVVDGGGGGGGHSRGVVNLFTTVRGNRRVDGGEVIGDNLLQPIHLHNKQEDGHGESNWQRGQSYYPQEEGREG